MTTPSEIDWEWFRSHLLDDILPRWRNSACTAQGLYLPHLDRQWRFTGNPTGTLVSQSRLLYNFSVGYRLTDEQRYLDAISPGAEFLYHGFYDREKGGYFYRCDRNGEVVEDFKDAYGHAFVLFGWAHAYWATQYTDYWHHMQGAYDLLRKFQDEYGGLVPRYDRAWHERTDIANPVNSQNPIMHAFEALLSSSLEQSKSFCDEFAASLVNYLFGKVGRPLSQGLPELYTPDGRALPTDAGGRVDIGHQFEWAFLLSRARELGAPERYLEWAETLLEYGLRVGFDSLEGGIFSNASLEGEVIDYRKGWWQQCEATRALMHFALVRKRDDLWVPLAKTIHYFQTHLIDPDFGGWYADERLNKGNEWKVDYHVVAMCEEAIRLAEMTRN
ncbi:MAG: AGE family epimerase/isomerase [Candidatus Zipacnadales bacterium]